MNVEDWQGDQGPVLTVASTPAISFHGYSPCDYAVEVGAIIFHPDSKRVLVYEENDGSYRLPTRKVRRDMASALRNPLDFFKEDTGYNLERLALRKFVKRLEGLESDSYYDLDAKTILLGGTSTNPFHFTLDLRWVPDDEGPFAHPKEVVTFWFAGLVTDEDPPDHAPRNSEGATRTSRLVDIEKADQLLCLDRTQNYSHLQALHVFVTLWQNRSAPDGVIDMDGHP